MVGGFGVRCAAVGEVMSKPSSSQIVLVIDPEATSAAKLVEFLAPNGVAVLVCGTGTEALARLDREPAQVVVTELALPDMTGNELSTRIGERWPGLPVVLIAGDDSVPSAVAGMRTGAADFLQKPLNKEEVLFVLNKALMVVQRRAAQPPPPSSGERAGILGESAAMRQVYETLTRAAHGTATLLVRGESGTGKELVARAIHEASPRSNQPFVKIDCASLPEPLLESELFGYEKGAFTGATARKPGRAELADKGTLFLDEIGELALPLQAKLLRLLQDRVIERLGGTSQIKVDVRVVAATHRDLDGMVERGEFRQDLFYRLNVVPLWLPPLRARREDIEPLARHFCSACGKANGKPEAWIEKEALQVLRSQKWPGNVRQLQNFIERLVVLTPGPMISAADVRTEFSRQAQFHTQPATSLGAPVPAPGQAVAAPVTDTDETLTTPPLSEAMGEILPLEAQVRAAEKRSLEQALLITKHNRSLAARILGVSRSTLYAKLKEHELL